MEELDQDDDSLSLSEDEGAGDKLLGTYIDTTVLPMSVLKLVVSFFKAVLMYMLAKLCTNRASCFYSRIVLLHVQRKYNARSSNLFFPIAVSSSGEDFRALNIFTPPPQVEPILEAASHSLPNGHSKHDCEEDLNKVDDEYLARKKAEMDAQFTANQLNPGDEGYVYDKEIEFDNGPKIESGWDSDGNDSYSDF